MECTICYETFLTPKTKRDFLTLLNEHETIDHFLNRVMTPTYNTTYTCPTRNCERLFCKQCWTTIKTKGRVPSYSHYFTCPFCRQIDWKNYKKNVLYELKEKVSVYN